MPRKVNAKLDLDEDTGQHEASGSATEGRADNNPHQTNSNDMLKAMGPFTQQQKWL